MSKAHIFKNSLEIGLRGKKIVRDFLTEYSNIDSIEDVHNNKSRYVDFKVNFNNNKSYSIVVRTDTYNTGNMFYETFSCVENKTPGWLYLTSSDYLFYYYFQSKELYILNIKALKVWFNENKGDFREKTFRNIGMNNKIYSSKGCLIPKGFLEDNFKFYKKYFITL